GQRVSKGQALAEVDSPDYAAAVSAYRKAAATAAVTRGIANRDQDLLRHQAIAQRELDQARTDAANAEADRKAALQALVAMNVGAGRLGDIEQGRSAGAASGVIRAPISGTVVERPVTAGLLLQAATTPVVTIADLSRVWVMAQVFEADLPFVRVGEAARIQAGGTSLPGTVENIGAEVDPATGAVPARIAVDNRAGLLKKQMYVRVAIEALRPSAGVVVPASAILRDDENLPFVYVAQPDGGFGRRRIVQGPRVGAGYQVADGLRAGEQIVVDGAIFVQFMQDQ
ncbi:MAG TPA: efflux RND transporter periplasmic adaptor subunit, partial [Caulobacteraceae bacterium]|nr:efflux RND transporter periplasmic adaptor subunit [Caulobacteraceae bacterium]